MLIIHYRDEFNFWGGVAPGTDQKPYSVFEVVKPIEVKSGVVAPWFNQQGGEIQYQLPKTVDELLDDGIIRRITQ